jgi:Uma2 family endonuclease
LESQVVIPETKPAIELIDGRLVQKMSPKRRHQELEMRWVLALRAWAGDRGTALTEWRVNFRAPGRRWGSLVPDVAYIKRETLEQLGDAASEEPPIAPDVVVEILSAGDSISDLEWKIGAYLDAGSLVVFVIDPPGRTVIARSKDSVVTFGAGDTVTHHSVPGFAYPIDEMFDGLYLG